MSVGRTSCRFNQSTIQRFKMDNLTGGASVQLCVLMATLLLVVRFLLDCFGLWYGDKTMATIITVIECLNYSMVHYTMGLMQLSAKKVNDYFQVWAVLLVTLQYSVKAGRLYERSKQNPLLDLMSSFWAANLIRMQTFFLLRVPLWLIWALDATRIITYFASSDRAATINQENMRLVSDYMRYEHTLGPSGDDATDSHDEFRMQFYKYLVCGEDLVLHAAQQERRGKSAQYKIRLNPDNKQLVTLEKIWNVAAGSSQLLGSTQDTGNRLKDVCLSFSLYKLLRRRFNNLPIHEASQEKTMRLVFDYILQENNNYERVFRVTNVELSFLQDWFYSKHAAMFADGFPVQSMLMSLFLVAATGYLAYPVHYIPERMDPADKNIITHGVLVTRVIVGLIVAKELSEVYLYVFSQWTKVLMICMHVKHQCLRQPIVEAAMRMVFWFIRTKWDQRIFQYNILISDSHTRKKFPRRIKLEPEVKTAVFESFKGLQQHPERLGSYFFNAFRSKEALMKQLTWAIELEADTHRILVWHIATCFCEIHTSDEAEYLKVVRLQNRLLARKFATQKDMWPHYSTAVTLSNYCAYLLTKALVPDNGIVVRNVLNVVREEFFRAIDISVYHSMQDVYRKLEKIAIEPSEESEKVVTQEGEDTVKGIDDIHNSITQMGSKLGKQLIETYEGDTVGLWRDLAVFWIGFLLHLAASTKAAKHKNRLDGEGELITHLWVLLSHAGFLRNTRDGQILLDPEDLNDADPLIWQI